MDVPVASVVRPYRTSADRLGGRLGMPSSPPRLQKFHPPLQPANLVLETNLPAELQQPPVVLDHVKPSARLQIAQVHRALMQRPPIGFGHAVRSVHQAVKVDAVLTPNMWVISWASTLQLRRSSSLCQPLPR